ncbi:putative aldehyde dehydrogenase family protein [Staphylococcus gallinarum]|uniref:Putative aldehyde dehydrogenase family protein n=1 Tax=Staphylococcus gallinarum TaxID=1293 RepID=A0A380FCQ7_STAGA|nr:putative aldehyde dehydrogenase family protein [Staphylococcus gallinarum]
MKVTLLSQLFFEDVTTDMKLWQDEIFAPVLSLVKVTDLKEGIALANKSEFANGACLFTDSASSIRYFREFIDAGMLGINLGVPAPMAVFPILWLEIIVLWLITCEW